MPRSSRCPRSAANRVTAHYRMHLPGVQGAGCTGVGATIDSRVHQLSSSKKIRFLFIYSRFSSGAALRRAQNGSSVLDHRYNCSSLGLPLKLCGLCYPTVLLRSVPSRHPRHEVHGKRSLRMGGQSTTSSMKASSSISNGQLRS